MVGVEWRLRERSLSVSMQDCPLGGGGEWTATLDLADLKRRG
jgi:hypothetical protein